MSNSVDGLTTRIVVTGHDSDGRSVVAEDRNVGWLPDPSPDYRFALLYGQDEFPTYPTTDVATKIAATSPGLGGFRLVHLMVPPAESVAIDAKREGRAGILTRAGDPPGMHFTASLDLVVVFSGEACCLLDDGSEIHLKTGDFLVQNGTAHAWQNHGTEPAHLGVVAVGVEHEWKQRHAQDQSETPS